MNRKIRNAAKGLIIKDGKMLAIKINDGNEEWYIMPGGGQEEEELLPETVCREVAEEVGIETEAKELVFVVEGAHDLYEGKPYKVYLGNEEVGDPEVTD